MAASGSFREPRIVAEGLQYTNEVRTDPTGAWLYVVETFGRRLTRFRIGSDGHLHDRAAVVTLGHGCFPDGFAFDEAGGIWVTSLISNRVLRVRGGGVETIVEDADPEFIAEVETRSRTTPCAASISVPSRARSFSKSRVSPSEGRTGGRYTSGRSTRPASIASRPRSPGLNRPTAPR